VLVNVEGFWAIGPELILIGIGRVWDGDPNQKGLSIYDPGTDSLRLAFLQMILFNREKCLMKNL
jgi:hypothetical protein